jgi:hypothetical protein
MKKTAVEWLAIEWNRIDNKWKNIGQGQKHCATEKAEALNQAKEMEKEQMCKSISFICHGCGSKHTGENDDQMYEVCKKCFINL